MNDPVGMLDQYREPILADREGFAILCLLFRDGTKTEDELSKDADMLRPAVKNHARRLFKSGLLRPVEPDEWTLTEFAENILFRVGVRDTAAESLLEDFGLQEWLATVRDQLDEDRRDYLLRDLRVINLSFSSLAHYKPAVMPHLQESVSSTICRHFAINWKKSDFPLVSVNWKDSNTKKATGLSEHVLPFKEWSRAKTSCERSNEFILNAVPPTNDTEKTIIYLDVFWRLADALAHKDQEPDNTLIKAFISDPKRIRDTWFQLRKWEPNTEAILRNTVRRVLGLRNDQVRFDILSRLEGTLSSAAAKSPKDQYTWSGHLKPLTEPELSLEAAIRSLAQIRLRIQRDTFRGASFEERQELLSELKLLSDAGEKWALEKRSDAPKSGK